MNQAIGDHLKKRYVGTVILTSHGYATIVDCFWFTNGLFTFVYQTGTKGTLFVKSASDLGYKVYTYFNVRSVFATRSFIKPPDEQWT